MCQQQVPEERKRREREGNERIKDCRQHTCRKGDSERERERRRRREIERGRGRKSDRQRKTAKKGNLQTTNKEERLPTVFLLSVLFGKIVGLVPPRGPARLAVGSSKNHVRPRHAGTALCQADYGDPTAGGIPVVQGPADSVTARHFYPPMIKGRKQTDCHPWLQ